MGVVVSSIRGGGRAWGWGVEHRDGGGGVEHKGGGGRA